MQFRQSLWIILGILIVPLFLFALGSGDVAKGKEVYKRCAICHGDSGEGKEAVAKAFGVPMPHLGSDEVQSLDDAALRKVITEGKGKMRPIGMSEEEITDVIAFLRSLKKQNP